jgi:hypothetical protein
MNHLLAEGHLFLIFENLELVSYVPQIDTNGRKGVTEITNIGTFPNNVPLLVDIISRSSVIKVYNYPPDHGKAMEKHNPGENLVLTREIPRLESLEFLSAHYRSCS